MKAKDYRRQVEQELGITDATKAATANAGEAADAGEAAMPAASRAEPDCAPLVSRLADSSVDPRSRLMALGALQAAAFLARHFDVCRPDYVAALQSAATAEDPELRRAALDVLTKLKDDFARDRLIRGLSNADEALVPPAVALGLLSADDHNAVREIARRFLGPEFAPKVRAQAVRLIGRDPGARELLTKLVRDKDEFREVRRAGAVALKNLNPDAFAAQARAILADASDFDDIRKTVRGALARSGLTIEEGPAAIPSPVGRLWDWLRNRLGGRPKSR
ncbi:MAG TPA: HEAT repeat domain-containing protein [Sphingomicrobium sp.]